MTPLEAAVFPAPDPWAGLSRGASPWWRPDASWVSCGTEALYWAFRRLQGAGAPPFAWIPSYHCGLEVQAALDAGWEVGFLEVAPDMTVAADSVRRALETRSGTIVLIHYFGILQPEVRKIRELLNDAGVALLEDCTHALGARVGIPAGADLAVFSLHKSLPVVDGGLLEVDEDRLRQKLGRAPGETGALEASSEARRLWAKATVKSLMGPGLRRRWQRARASEEEEAWSNHEPGRYGFETSAWTRRVARGTDLIRLAERRRRHYRRLVDRLKGYEQVLVFPEIGEEDCPLGLPLRVSDRARFIRGLRALGIEPYIFGEFAHPALTEEDFPEVAPLRDEVVALPIHDRLPPGALEVIGDHVRDLLGSEASRKPSTDGRR